MIELPVTLTSTGGAVSFASPMTLGYTKNKGVYRLLVTAEGEWEDLTIRCFWHLPGGTDPASSLVQDGFVDVPASVTAQPGTGCITFEGSDGEKTVTSADLRYKVGSNSGTEDGTMPEPGAPAWEQLVGEVEKNTAAALDAVQKQIGDLNNLTTKAKENLVAAINEAAKTGSGHGGGGSITMRTDGGYIQYSKDDGETWENLIALSDLKGEPGEKGADGEPGADGAPGQNGADGAPGADGFSPTATVSETTYGARITITDKNGTTEAQVLNGKDGQNGADGQPGRDGTDGAPGRDGVDGQPGKDGADGITPTIGANGNWFFGATDTGKPSRGVAGDTGPTGATGAQGPAGTDGKSAYQYAVEGGYTGTEEAFAAKLSQEMPTTLPNPNALTFTGAVSATYDGSAPVSVEIPQGGGGGGGGGSAFSPQLIASLVADGTTTSILQDIDVAYPGIYTVAIIGTSIADTENAGQSLFAKFGASNIYMDGVDVRAIQTVKNNYQNQFVAVTFALDSEKCFHVIGKAENYAANTSNWMNTCDGKKISTNAIFFYSSTSKIIPAGFTCNVWRWA